MSVYQASNMSYDASMNINAYMQEYDDMLLGKRKTFSASLLSKENGAVVCEGMLRIIFKHYMHWTPTQVRDCLTPSIATRMHLFPLINRLPCPPEVIRKEELYYVAWALYPETKNRSEIELIRKVYDDLLNGTKVRRFPKGYFDFYIGELRSRMIFKIFYREYLLPVYRFESVRDLYLFFASKKINPLLSKYKLTTLVHQKFHIPLNFLHSSLGPEADDKLYVEALGTLPPSKWGFCLLSERDVLAANGGIEPQNAARYRAYLARKAQKSVESDMKEVQSPKTRGRPRKFDDCTEITEEALYGGCEDKEHGD